ncbi:hypothetical protein F2Q70_00037378 [Brassica cretica]|uniref:Cytochrome P450 n=1 Tax=Brassica cretica TaxID=69181 RepID=A0A8S9JWI0_BRACR|nr:hypothetical protein F2Q70_00037378 [Brassica cretica]
MDTCSLLFLFSFLLFAIIIVIIFNEINGLRSSLGSKKKIIDHVNTNSHGPVFPQGSLGWPVIGETIEFISSAYSDHPESFMDKRRLMYGKVFKSHIFGTATIVSTDAEVNKIVLQSDPTAFVPFYPKTVRELMGKSSILLINGSLHRRFHGLVGSFLKSPLLKAQVVKDMHKYLSESMDQWSEDQPVLLQDISKTVAFKVLAKALISVEKGEELDELKKEFEQFIKGLMSLPVNFPGTQLHRSLQAKKKMVKQVEKIIDGKVRRAKNKEEDDVIAKDVVDVLLKVSSENLTHNLIANNMVDMMIPGHDSVPVLITLAVKFLSDSPSALHFLTEENMELKRLKELTGEPLYWNDYLSLPFTQKLAFQTASAPFASEPLAIPTATAPVRRSAARVSNLNPFASRPARVQLASCPPDQLQPQCVPDTRKTQLHPASRTTRVPDYKRPVRIIAARDPDCNSSRSTISCSRLQPQSVRVQASSCSARFQLAFLPSSRFILLVVRFQQSTKTKGKFEFQEHEN